MVRHAVRVCSVEDVVKILSFEQFSLGSFMRSLLAVPGLSVCLCGLPRFIAASIQCLLEPSAHRTRTPLAPV